MPTIDDRLRLAGRHGIVLLYARARIGNALVSADSVEWRAGGHPGLLPAGLRATQLADLQRLAVDSFASSTTRKRLWTALERFLEAAADVPGLLEVWIGGSFLSTKVDPGDVDVVVVLEPDAERVAYDPLLDQTNLLAQGLDVSAMFEGDLILRAYWQGAFTFGTGAEPRGIAVLRPGTRA